MAEDRCAICGLLRSNHGTKYEWCPNAVRPGSFNSTRYEPGDGFPYLMPTGVNQLKAR